MFKIQVSSHIIDHCKRQVELYDFGRRCVANGNKEQLEMFGLGLIDGADGFDNGKDISYKGLVIDVKTMGRTVDVRPDIYIVHLTREISS